MNIDILEDIIIISIIVRNEERKEPLLEAREFSCVLAWWRHAFDESAKKSVTLSI